MYKLKMLSPKPIIVERGRAFPLTNQEINVKYCQIKASILNRSYIILGSDEQELVGDPQRRNGIELRAGESFIIDIDHTRRATVDLRDILLAGEVGDSVSVVYLEEVSPGAQET